MKPELLFVSALLAVLLLSGCSQGHVLDPPLQRAVSPDGKVDVVTTRSPDTDMIFVYLAPHSHKLEEKNLCLVADAASNFSVQWQDNYILLIRYDQARISRFLNFWFSADVDNWNHYTELRLAPRKKLSVAKFERVPGS